MSFGELYFTLIGSYTPQLRTKIGLIFKLLLFDLSGVSLEQAEMICILYRSEPVQCLKPLSRWWGDYLLKHLQADILVTDAWGNE